MTNAFVEQLEARLLDLNSDLSHLDARGRVDYVKGKASSSTTPIIAETELVARFERSIQESRPLRVKLGIDPTGSDIHLGHAVVLLNLRRFLRMGCEIELVVGDFTAMIGDPSGRNDERPDITEEQVAANMRSYREQAGRVIDLGDLRVRWSYNGSWMRTVDLLRWRELTSRLPAAELFQRADFRSRLAAGHSLSLAELEYAVYMAYDSVVLNPDLEIGGIDQLLNLQVCRRLMQASGQAPEVIVTYDLLPGITGERDDEGRAVKMSKSRNNFIAVMAEASDMYGATMSIPDDTMWEWFRSLTEIGGEDLEELKARVAGGEVHPKAAKELLARVMVATFHAHDEGAAARAAHSFGARYGRQRGGGQPENVLETPVNDADPLYVVLARASGNSNSHVRRLAAQRGIRTHEPGGEEPLVMSIDDLDKPAAGYAGRIIRLGRHTLIRVRPAGHE